jgi:hypothetical protein
MFHRRAGIFRSGLAEAFVQAQARAGNPPPRTTSHAYPHQASVAVVRPDVARKRMQQNYPSRQPKKTAAGMELYRHTNEILLSGNAVVIDDDE